MVTDFRQFHLEQIDFLQKKRWIRVSFDEI